LLAHDFIELYEDLLGVGVVHEVGIDILLDFFVTSVK